MTGPGGGDVPAADRLVLAGDETALPAIARILEGLPAEVHAVVRVEVQDETQEIALPSARPSTFVAASPRRSAWNDHASAGCAPRGFDPGSTRPVRLGRVRA